MAGGVTFKMVGVCAAAAGPAAGGFGAAHVVVTVVVTPLACALVIVVVVVGMIFLNECDRNNLVDILFCIIFTANPNLEGTPLAS